MTSSYSSSLVHSFSDPKCCFLLWKIWIPILLKWDESQESINRQSCWFVIVTVFFQSTNWIWFCCFNMFWPKCCLKTSWIASIGSLKWPCGECCKSIRKWPCLKIRGWRAFQILKIAPWYFSATRSDESLLTANCSFEQSCLRTKTGTAEVMRFYQNGPETGLRCKSLISATHFRVLLYDVMIYLHYVFILHNAFHKYISSANLVRCSHHLVAKRWAHQL